MAYTTIDNSQGHFNINLWSADDSNPRSITTTHATDWVWIKSRNQTYIHRLFDSVRGATKRLRSNGPDLEDTASTEVTGFTSTGYTINSGLNSTGPATNWVGWSWKAGTSFSNDASSTSVGTIDSTGSISTTAGFGIISYTGNGSAGASIAHGLGVVPDVLLVKGRSIGDSWTMYHKAIASDPETDMVKLDENAVPIDSNVFWNDTAPTSSVFTVDGAGGETKVNDSGKTYIAYCFKSIKGYSKFGGYKGNGNTDGTFVFLGFRPAWVLVRRIDGAENWAIFDNKLRPANNVGNGFLYPDLTNAEDTSSDFDMLSNGFKTRTASNLMNGSGASYIYWAFAESPFVNSNGVPNNAR